MSLHRYARLGYVTLGVTDLDRSEQFYRTIWGMERARKGASGDVFMRCSNSHQDVVLTRADQGALKRIGWQLEGERELDKAAASLVKAGLVITELPSAETEDLQQGRTFRFACPFSGVTHEYYATVTAAPQHDFTKSVTDFDRLGHVVIKVPDYAEAIAFYQNVLNFRISDQVEQFITFMRCFPNPYHHSFGVAKGDKSGLHHVCFMVASIDDIGRGLWRFRKNEIPIVYGPGRHPPSSSYFLYVLDPDGLTIEYSHGMEEFPEQNPRDFRVFPPALESIDSWGSTMDPRMGAAGKI